MTVARDAAFRHPSLTVVTFLGRTIQCANDLRLLHPLRHCFSELRFLSGLRISPDRPLPFKQRRQFSPLRPSVRS